MAISNTGAMRKALASPAVQGAVKQKVGKGCQPSTLRPVGVKNVSDRPSPLENKKFLIPRASVHWPKPKWASEYTSASCVGPRPTAPFVVPKATCFDPRSDDLGRAPDVNPPSVRRASDLKGRSEPHLKGPHTTPFSNRTWPGAQPSSAPMVSCPKIPRAQLAYTETTSPRLQWPSTEKSLDAGSPERSHREKGSVGNRNSGPSYHFDNMQGGAVRPSGTKPLNFIPPKQEVVIVREAPLRGILKNPETSSRPIHTQSVRFDAREYSTPCYRVHYNYTDSDSDSDSDSE